MESVALDRSDTVGFGVIAITYLILVNNGIKVEDVGDSVL